MASTSRFPLILMADDDPFSCKLARLAMEENRSPQLLYSVQDGEEVLDYLYQRGQYSNPNSAPRPDLILLDLNMPRKDGRETLCEIRQTPEFSHIPVVIMTSSSNREDIYTSYKMGANSYITKPVSFEGLVQMMDMLIRYWFELVNLPEVRVGDPSA